jgi:molybdopterin-guanine dinucleotide biosynthesis protein B
MKPFGLVGWKNSGKTTLLVELIPLLVRRGLKVSTLKHGHHAFDIDQPGKDSYRHRMAGATEVLLGSSARWALMHELREEGEPTAEELLTRMSPVDLVLVEGFKAGKHPKLEVHRPIQGHSLISAEDPNVVAIASDGPLAAQVSIPVLDLNNHAAIVDFILDYCGLAAPARLRHGAAG